jgi:hypothetical protein
MTRHDCLHILRNPYGHSQEKQREAALFACDEIERLERRPAGQNREALTKLVADWTYDSENEAIHSFTRMGLRRCANELNDVIDGPNSYRTQLHDYLDSRDFYELCQQYRHARDIIPLAEEYPTAAEAFEKLKAEILKNAAPQIVPPGMALGFCFGYWAGVGP